MENLFMIAVWVYGVSAFVGVVVNVWALMYLKSVLYPKSDKVGSEVEENNEVSIQEELKKALWRN